MRILVLLFLVLLSACATLDKPFIYQAKKPADTMYIFGTMHVAIPIEDVPSVVMDKFDNAQKFGLEVDSNDYEMEKKLDKDVAASILEMSALLKSLQDKNPGKAEVWAKELHVNYYK